MEAPSPICEFVLVCVLCLEVLAVKQLTNQAQESGCYLPMEPVMLGVYVCACVCLCANKQRCLTVCEPVTCVSQDSDANANLWWFCRVV